MKAELTRNNQDPSPREFLLWCGIEIPTGEQSKSDSETLVTFRAPEPCVAFGVPWAYSAEDIIVDNPRCIKFPAPEVETVSQIYFTPPTEAQNTGRNTLGYPGITFVRDKQTPDIKVKTPCEPTCYNPAPNNQATHKPTPYSSLANVTFYNTTTYNELTVSAEPPKPCNL